MAQKRKSDFIDPDYTSFTSNVKDNKKPKVKEDGNTNIEKIFVIIKREFQRELSDKEEEVLKIENSIAEAKKMLQRVRYAVVKSYYTKLNNQLSEGEIKAVGEYEKMSYPNGIIDEKRQMPIHPSLKKLIGKKPIDYNELLCARPMRKAAQTAISNINEKCIKHKPSKSNITASVAFPNKRSEEKIPRYISPIKQNVEIPKLNSSRGKNQSKHLIVVGNTSKYIGDEKSKDAVTHKWLVFLRTKTSVPIEDIVQKVRFYLHPSYRPNDVIDVTSPPFQLTRRGWGEFPIRLMVHFYKHIQQKPVQIIHSLVLDKKFTGHQTMGAETILEMWINNSLLHTINDKIQKKSESKSINFCEEKTEDDCLKHPRIMVKKELEFPEVVNEKKIELKHTNEDKMESLQIIQSQNGTFIDDHDYFVRPATLEIQIQKESVSNPIKLYQNEILIELQKLNPSSTSEAVKFLLKEMPLINPRVVDSIFKSNFPFAMESEMKWNQMSSIKQKTKQWFRANLISKMLEQHSALKNDVWSTREIAAFSRCHGYDKNQVTTANHHSEKPHQNLRNIVQHEINKEKYPHRSMTACLELKQWLHSHQSLFIPKNIIEEDVNIVDCVEKSFAIKTTHNTEIKPKIMPLNKNILLESKFVTSACAEIGIQLKPEEILPGIVHKTSNLMLISATKCFLEDLLRRALADRYSSTRETSDLLVTPKNIQNALQTREEFDFLTNFNLAGLQKNI